MVVLKKIRASTLVETIVASVIIVLIFGIASSVLNNVFKTALQSDKSNIYYEMERLTYLYKNNALKMPYTESFDGFNIVLEENGESILMEAVSDTSKQLIAALKIGINE
jgi:hypothetical protein